MKMALENYNLPWIPITGLFIFVICFTVFVYWTYKKENKEVYDHAAMIPLEENSNERR